MNRPMKDENGKFIKYVMEGHLQYPSLNRPNTKFNKQGVYETYLCPIDKKEISQANDMKIKTKEWEDAGVSMCVYFSQYTRRKDGTENRKPGVITEDGKPFQFNDNGRDVIIGNGTRAKIQYYISQINNSYGTFTKYLINKVKILDLVEYTPENNSDPTEVNEENLDF